MSKQQMIADLVVLYRKDGDIAGIYTPGSAFAGVPTEIAKFLRGDDIQNLLHTKCLFASVVEYDFSTRRVLNVDMYNRNDTVKDPLDFMQRLLDRPNAKEGLDHARRKAKLSSFPREGFLEIYEKSKENTLPVLKEMDFQPPGETIYCFDNHTRNYIYFCIVRPLGTNNALGAFQILCKPTPEDIIHVDRMWYVVGTGKIVGMDCLNREQRCWEPADPKHVEEMQEFLDAPNQRAELRRTSEDMRYSPPPPQGEVRICDSTMAREEWNQLCGPSRT